MPTTATQLPFLGQPAARAGRKLFRKMVLPVGTVKHPEHGELHFTADRLTKLRESFLGGALNQAPFVLVDENNRHTDLPERFRGEVKGLELTSDGLLATIETTEDGTKLLTDNPNLPVSVRIKTLDDGREVLAHVAGTFDPVWKNSGPWEPIDASDTGEVLDLTAGGVYSPLSMAEPQTPPQGNGSEPEALSTEEVGRFRAFLQKLGGSGEQAPPAGTQAQNPPEGQGGESTPPQSPPNLDDAAVAELLDSLAGEPTGQERQPVALSQQNPEVVELTQRVERAEVRAGTAELANRLSGYLDAGVPPTLINAAKAQLLGDSDEHKAIAIDFANGREPAAAKALFAVLDGAKGTIDFTEQGSSSTSTEDEGRKALLDAWEKNSG